ncbi:MAG: CDP-diacylglycerol--serine O-phosphatidyltransferase [Bacteroidales bacterium]|jgi:CDP-diacylglycerol--serine O-phosphatidyltransferase|nr:CDP-diacylglycerol--serine O-phosphatidyltransferase [Bacteroidales bacterium]
MKHVPNFITSLNLASGFISVIFVINGDLVTASWLLLAAMIFDFLDGFSARLLKAYSDIGKELDSLADVISFGLAPATIIYRLLLRSMDLSEPFTIGHEGFLPFIILCTTAIMPVCAGLRLAIFNTDESQSRSFKGLPTPANALAVISLIISARYSGAAASTWLISSPPALVVLTIVLSLLMVSRVPLLSLKISNLKFKGNEGLYILVFLTAVSFAFGGGIAAAYLLIPIYIVSSLAARLFR